jgi:hypothetical protein
LHLDGANIAIDARPAFLRRRGRLHGTTNGHSPRIVETAGYRKTTRPIARTPPANESSGRCSMERPDKSIARRAL